MKKLLSIALCATAVSAFADPVEVELGTVGVTAITTSLSNVIVAVSYDDLAGGTGMVYSNLVKTTNLTVGDRLVEFRDNKYTGWVLEQSGDVKYWREQQGVFKDSAGKDITLSSPAADTATGAVGTGIWLVRQNPTDDKGVVPFYIYGKPVSAPVSNISSNTWTLVGNPLQKTTVKIGTDAAVSKTAVVKDPQTGDQIVTVEANGKLHYFVYVGSSWIDGSSDPVDISVGPGIGFWIRTQADTTITWPKDEE